MAMNKRRRRNYASRQTEQYKRRDLLPNLDPIDPKINFLKRFDRQQEPIEGTVIPSKSEFTGETDISTPPESNLTGGAKERSPSS